MKPSKILLVDADRGYAQALTLVLRQQGDEVEVAHGPAEALEAARSGGYDLAVVDLFTE